MHGLNNPFPAPGADDIHRRFSLGPPDVSKASKVLQSKCQYIQQAVKSLPDFYPRLAE